MQPFRATHCMLIIISNMSTFFRISFLNIIWLKFSVKLVSFTEKSVRYRFTIEKYIGGVVLLDAAQLGTIPLSPPILCTRSADTHMRTNHRDCETALS